MNAARRIHYIIRPWAQPLLCAAVNRGREFSGTFGIDAAQLDRFAPLQMTYPPIEEEVKILAFRHAEVPAALLDDVEQ